MTPRVDQTTRRSRGSRGAERSALSRALRNQAPSRRAGVPRPAAAAVGALFRGVSALRSARSLHPYGVVFEATVAVERPVRGLDGVPLLSRAGSYDAAVRLSRAAGLPQPLPDGHGLTVRVVDAHGEGQHQDFLLHTSLDGAFLHHLLLPSRGFFSLPYSSVLLYRIGGALKLVGALPRTKPVGGGTDFEQLLRTTAGREVRFALALAEPFGRWQPLAEIRLGERVPAADAESLRFNPWNTGGGIRPVGPLMGLREAAYRESQRGWAGEQPRPS